LFARLEDREKGIVCSLDKPIPVEKYWDQMVFSLSDVAKIEAKTYLQIEHAAAQLAQEKWGDGSDRSAMIANLAACYQATGHDVKDSLQSEEDSYLLQCVRLQTERQYQQAIDALIKDSALQLWQLPSMTPTSNKAGAFVSRDELVQAIKNRKPIAQTLHSNEATAASDSVATQSAEQRQALRYQMIIDAGLIPPKDTYGRLPRGVGVIAKKLKITTQAFSEDVKKHIERRSSKDK